MDEQKQKIFAKPIVIAILVIVVLVILTVFGLIKPRGPKVPLITPEAEKMPTPRDAYEIALEYAHKNWQKDAVLSSLSSEGKVSATGRSDFWKYTFISSSTPSKGYVVEVETQRVTSASEIPFVGGGAPLPENIISQEEAIKQVKTMPGFENIEILGVEAVYGEGGKVWYWGVKTGRGVVSVEARKK